VQYKGGIVACIDSRYLFNDLLGAGLPPEESDTFLVTAEVAKAIERGSESSRADALLLHIDDLEAAMNSKRYKRDFAMI